MQKHLSLRTTITATLVGNTLEWYEFSLYVYFAPIFSKLFFPEQSPTASLLNILLIFAIGFISRPIGALFFGRLGDHLGRRNVLIATIVLMTIPTFFIGFLPTYAQIGIAAPLLLTLMRLLQGFPSGGELSGAMCYLIEISSSKKWGFMGSWVFFGSQLGTILSTCEFLALEQLFAEKTLLNWGWRISFIVGGLLGLIGLYLRKKLKETPAFERIKKEGNLSKRPIMESISLHKKALFQGILICILPLAGWYVIFVFNPLYFSEIIGMKHSSALLLNVGMLILSNLCLPLLGHLGDKYSKKHMLIGSAFLLLLIAFPFYFQIKALSIISFLIFEICAVLLLSIHFALLPMLLCELFPTALRYTCVAISYNFCNLFFGGAAPFLALYLVNISQNTLPPAILLTASAILSLLALFSLKEKGYS